MTTRRECASDGVIQDLYAIRLEAETIAAHRDDPCQFWTGHGCEMSMVTNAEKIMQLVDGLLPRERHVKAARDQEWPSP